MLLALVCQSRCAAQLGTPPATIEDALKQIAARAGVVFTGSVTRVTAAPNGDASVDFAVEQGIRGVASSGAYTMRVSSWAGGAERFHAGERALFLLLAPSTGGYSSPVEGEHGIVPLAGDAAEGSVDLRWLATLVQRDAPVQSATSQQPIRRTPATGMARPTPAEQQMRQSNVTGQDVHAIDRDMVTGMLRTWLAAGTRVQGVPPSRSIGATR